MVIIALTLLAVVLAAILRLREQVGRYSFQGCRCSSFHYHFGNSISVVFRMVDRIDRQLCFGIFIAEAKPIFTYYDL